jgi:hypothetical protein
VRPTGRWLASRQHSCNRCEKVTPVKAGREALGLPGYVPTARACSTALNQFEQAVPGADIPAAISLYNDGRARAADARIDNAEKDGSRGKPSGISRQQVSRCLGIADRRISEEINQGHAWHHLMQHRLHLTRIGALQPEICEQHNHVLSFFPNGGAKRSYSNPGDGCTVLQGPYSIALRCALPPRTAMRVDHGCLSRFSWRSSALVIYRFRWEHSGTSLITQPSTARSPSAVNSACPRTAIARHPICKHPR